VFDPAIAVPTPVLAFAAEGLDMSRYLFACLVVLGLLCLGAFALTRLKNSAIVQRAKKRSLRIVDVLPLGRKQRLCVVRAYDRTFVLGVGEREVALVAEIDQDDDLASEALVQAESEASAAKAPTSFAALVQSFAGAALQRRTTPTEPLAPVAAPVAVAPVVGATDDVERRAASAARDALLSILEERRAEAAARREQKRASEKARLKNERSDAAAVQAPRVETADAPLAASAPAPKPRTRSTPLASARVDTPAAAPLAASADASAAATKARASWVG
jgi:flagellar biogenesis protein FliO